MGNVVPGLSAVVFGYCVQHPWAGPELEEEHLVVERYADGAIKVVGRPPDIIAVSVLLLDEAPPEVTFRNGLLAIAVEPQTLYYRPLYRHSSRHYFVFRRDLPDDGADCD